MALGPEEQDSWNDTAGVALLQRRWFPQPHDIFVRLHVNNEVWQSLNRFQRYLWYVDDVECRWQALKQQGGFEWMEVDLESLNCFDGGEGYEKLAKFLRVEVRKELIGRRDNSIEHKKRGKLAVEEDTLRKWDEEYKRVVGPCVLADGQSYRWINS